MSKKPQLPASQAGVAKIGDTPTVPAKITAPLDEPQEALENAARERVKREAEEAAKRTMIELWERQNTGEPFDVWMKRLVKEVAERAAMIAKRTP
jgi:hypothetical protein